MNEKLLQIKLSQLINDIEFMEDFIKACVFDRHQPTIEPQSGKEILRLISDMKNRSLA